MRVSICIATFRRPLGLERVVRGLDALEFAGEAPEAVEIVVIDNDPEGSAREVCEALAAGRAWPLRYEHEPNRGLSRVRNHAVASCRDSADAIAFIDDDEEPTPRWLDVLLRVQAEYDADVVLGPTLRRFEGDVPGWVERGGFFVEDRHPTGTILEHGGIGNSLIHMRAFSEDPPFDDRMGTAGGEDTLFFLRLTQRGGKIVWADEAVVHEWVPAARATAPWILKRVYRTSNTWGLCERELRPGLRVGAERIAKGLARIAFGVGLLPIAWVFGRHLVVRSLWYVCFGAGNITGLFGLQYHEYK